MANLKLTGKLWLSLSVRDLSASLDWYRNLFGFEVQSESRTDGFDAAILVDPESGTSIGLISHNTNPTDPFSETRTGLDHLEFIVPDDTAFDASVSRLDELGIEHSEIKERPSGARIVTFRDPDNIQLEFYKPGSDS
jgi:glyoxylase I family protein